MRPAKISKRAERDLLAIREHIAKDNPEAAVQVWEALLETADLLADHTSAGNSIINAGPRHADIRWFLVPRFRNYLIFYRPDGNTILVLRVLHASRDWTRFFGH